MQPGAGRRKGKIDRLESSVGGAIPGPEISKATDPLSRKLLRLARGSSVLRVGDRRMDTSSNSVRNRDEKGYQTIPWGATEPSGARL